MLHPGEQIGVWTVDERLGRSSSSLVFRVHNREAPELTAAIKLLDPTREDWRELRQRLLHDAESLLALSHPNVAKVRGIRVAGHLPYLEMELIEGQALAIPKDPLSPGRVCDWLSSAAAALAAMHAVGLRHRDVKLENLILRKSDRQLVLVDLGTYRAAHPSPHPSLAYLPPEADAPGQLDPVLWDLHALGICAWELLSGKPAFRDAVHQGMGEVCRLKRALGPLDPGEDLPVDLRALVRELTHPVPRKRLRTATQLLERLSDLNLERTDPRFTFDKGVSTWDPEDPKPKRLSDASNATWHPSDPSGFGQPRLSEHAAPTMPPPEPSDPPDDSEPPPTEELDRSNPEPRRPEGELPPRVTEPRTTGGQVVAVDRTSQLLVGLIMLLLVALGVSLAVLLTR